MQELADGISVSKQLIGKIEQGNRVITDDVLSKLVDYFGLNKTITKDYRAFLMKDAMDKIEVQRVKIRKLEKESEEIEIEDYDPETDTTYMRLYNTMDVTNYIYESYELSKEVLIKKIKDRLGSIIDESMKDQGESNEYASFEYALSKADEKVAFYDKIVSLDSKADPIIFQKMVRALSIATSGGLESDSFTRKLIKLIKDELERKKKEQEKAYKEYQEIFGEDN